MKEIVAKSFIAAALLDVLDMHEDQTAKDVRAFIEAHPEIEAAIMRELDRPETAAAVIETARSYAREALGLLKACAEKSA